MQEHMKENKMERGAREAMYLELESFVQEPFYSSQITTSRLFTLCGSAEMKGWLEGKPHSVNKYGKSSEKNT